MKLAYICAVAMAVCAFPAAAENPLSAFTRAAGERLVDSVLNGRSSSGDDSTIAGPLTSYSASAFQRYGNWDFRLEELKVGVDEQWQAVIGVRNAAGHRQGMVASEIKVFLISEDGETLVNWGELYRASVEGSSAGLETALGTLWLEPKDKTRIRLRFDNSRDVKPVKIRIQSTGATAQTRTFDLE